MTNSKPIGGYFEISGLYRQPYYKNCLSFNNARNCLRYLIKKRKIQTIYVPKYLCSSVFTAVKKENCILRTYNIDSNFTPLISSIKKDEYIYIVNYYGQLDNYYIEELSKNYRHLIVDNAQAFFQKPVSNIDTIYTCRKFFGVPDGAYLFTDLKCNCNFEYESTYDHCRHIIGRLEKNAEEFYLDYQNSEKRFENSQIKLMSKFSETILGAIDYDTCIQKRNSNFLYLNAELRDINLISPHFNNGPFCYPFAVENGDYIRKELIKHKIFVPVLWPNIINDESVKHLALNILPLPCDHRYDTEQMIRIIKIIKEIK